MSKRLTYVNWLTLTALQKHCITFVTFLTVYCKWQFCPAPHFWNVMPFYKHRQTLGTFSKSTDWPKWNHSQKSTHHHSPVHLIHPYSPPLHHKHGYAGHTLSHPCTVWNPYGTSGAQFGMLEQLSLDSQSHLSHHGNERVHHKPDSSQYISSCPYTGTHLGDTHKRDHEERLRGLKGFSGWQSSIKYQNALIYLPRFGHLVMQDSSSKPSGQSLNVSHSWVWEMHKVEPRHITDGLVQTGWAGRISGTVVVGAK